MKKQIWKCNNCKRESYPDKGEEDLACWVCPCGGEMKKVKSKKEALEELRNEKQ